jgi:diaminohydroxyphosphoribosylaminopyrimidine deaminase/5-amino-6-(5-phosphoribosylamino)uracil reductase
MSQNFLPIDVQFMRRALGLARKGEGLTSPNPCVGAVLVRNGKILGEGWHQKAGQPHAEVEAVLHAKRRGKRVAGATLYVTLEPCSTHGRTPPCVELIVREKIKRVVIGTIDPNPAHAGRGLAWLRKRGIAVDCGILGDECRALNRAFNHWITTGKPWVVAKIAMSQDGKITAPPGKSRWITGPAARHKAHELRFLSDAIVVGAKTVRADNPRLTIRGIRLRGKTQPWRVVLTRTGQLPKKAHLFTDRYKDRTLVYRKVKILRVLQDLAGRGVTRVLLEGGGKLLGSAFDADCVNEVAFFVAPVILGTRTPAVDAKKPGKLRLTDVHWEKVGRDLFCRGFVES